MTIERRLDGDKIKFEISIIGTGKSADKCIPMSVNVVNRRGDVENLSLFSPHELEDWENGEDIIKVVYPGAD